MGLGEERLDRVVLMSTRPLPGVSGARLRAVVCDRLGWLSLVLLVFSILCRVGAEQEEWGPMERGLVLGHWGRLRLAGAAAAGV